MQLNQLRKDLKFNGELLALVETLKNVAGSQYHLMEKEKERFEAFMDAFSHFFRVINLIDVDNPLVRISSAQVGLIVVTSDSGFMGGLNQSVIRDAFDVAAGYTNGDPSRISLVVIGDKGAMTLSDTRQDFEFFPGISQDCIYEQAVAVRDHIVKEVLARRMGRVLVAYPRPLSFTAQVIEVISLLPCAELFDSGAESDVSQHTGPRLLSDARNVIVESSFSDIVQYLAAVWVTAKLFEIFEDSKLAEFSARAMHLENSFQKVEKEHKKLKRMCFKAAHELIDKGMRESFAATKSNKKKRAAAGAA